SRISSNGRLTLVIDSNAKKVQTLYTISLYEKLDEAILDLAVREGCPKDKIGWYIKNSNEFSPNNFGYQEEIKEWINDTDCDAVIWTNLSEKWKTKDNNGRDLVIE